MIYKLPYQKELAIKAIEVAKEGYICEVKKAKQKRSLNQNSYYWGVVIKMFSIEFGYTDQETHQLYANRFLKYERKNKEFVKSTKDLSTIEFENYLEHCRQFAAKGGLSIPLPNEVTEELISQLEAWRFV